MCNHYGIVLHKGVPEIFYLPSANFNLWHLQTLLGKLSQHNTGDVCVVMMRIEISTHSVSTEWPTPLGTWKGRYNASLSFYPTYIVHTGPHWTACNHSTSLILISDLISGWNVRKLPLNFYFPDMPMYYHLGPKNITIFFLDTLSLSKISIIGKHSFLCNSIKLVSFSMKNTHFFPWVWPHRPKNRK